MKQIIYSEISNSPNWTGYIVGIVIGSLIIVITATYLFYLFIKNRVYQKLLKRVGVIASQAINSDISLWARHTHQKFMSSLLIRYEENKFLTIDSLLITDKALIVIEIKSIKGGIRGSFKDYYWTKITDNVSQQIPNIVEQNEQKITELKKLLQFNIPIVSLVVFSNKATFIDLTDLPSHVVVTKHTDIFHALDKINQNLPKSIEKEMKRKIIRKLKTLMTNKSKDKIYHEQIKVKELKV